MGDWYVTHFDYTGTWHGRPPRAARASSDGASMYRPAERCAAVAEHWAENVRIIAVIPAHNEETALPRAVASVRAQQRPAQDIIVLADNCSDGTATVAGVNGCRVIETVGNTDRKAGALNQALPGLLDELDGADLVMVTDADSMIAPQFIGTAIGELYARSDAGAIGGVFYGEAGSGLVGALQRNEYARYGREIARRAGRAVVLTGTATVFRVSVLREIAAARGRVLPGRRGCVYDGTALTEDNEITLAIKHLGWATLSPRQCRVSTEIMPTWSDLRKQRLRWQRGALENLRTYRLTRVTLPYVIKQFSMYGGIVAVNLMLFTCGLFAYLGLLTPPHGAWWALLAVFVLERVWTVRSEGPVAVVLAALMVFEFVYDLFQQVIFVQAAVEVALRRTAQWHHLPPQGKE